MLSYAPLFSIRSPYLMGLELIALQISISTAIRLIIFFPGVFFSKSTSTPFSYIANALQIKNICYMT